MKKVFFTLTSICLFTMYAYSQKAKFGVTAGTALSNYKWEFYGVKISNKSKPGFTGGFFMDFPAGKGFSFQPAVNIVQKGSRYSIKELDWEESVSNNLIEIPMNILYNKNGFFIGAGPSMALGISGKEKQNDAGEKTETKLKFGNSEEDDLKKMDWGLNFLAGYKFKKGFLISTNYTQGLNNLIPTNPEGAKIKSHYIGFKMGYMFSKG